MDKNVTLAKGSVRVEKPKVIADGPLFKTDKKKNTQKGK